MHEVKQSKNGKFAFNYKASQINLEMQIFCTLRMQPTDYSLICRFHCFLELDNEKTDDEYNA